MKHRIPIAALLLSSLPALAFAASPPIEEVDLGSCWVQDGSATQGAPFFKIASFSIGSPITAQLYLDPAPEGATVTKAVKAALLEALPGAKGTLAYSLAIHCSSSQAMPLISATVDGENFCLQGRLTSGDNQIQIERVLPDPLRRPNEVCRGVNPGVLLFGLKDKSKAAAAETALLKREGALIEKIERLDAIGVLILRLKKSEYYRETAAKARIEKDARLAAYRGSLAFDAITLTVGAPVELWKDSISIR